jgi:hypothetical protein
MICFGQAVRLCGEVLLGSASGANSFQKSFCGHFPQFRPRAMLRAQVLGTSMGYMHSWVWGETYPDFTDALMPIACLPVKMASRNRIWRKMVIKRDPPKPGLEGR